MGLAFLFLIAALLLFLLDTFGVRLGSANLQSLGLACLVLSMLVGGASIG